MSTIQEVLRHKYLSKLSNRNIETLGIASKSAVSNYIGRFEKSGLEIHEALAMPEHQLLSVLFPELKQHQERTSRPHPDWNDIHTELSQKSMTRLLLWEEYARAKRQSALGVQKTTPRRLRLHPVQRVLQPLQEATQPFHATDTLRRRQALCGLQRTDGSGGGRDYR